MRLKLLFFYGLILTNLVIGTPAHAVSAIERNTKASLPELPLSSTREQRLAIGQIMRLKSFKPYDILASQNRLAMIIDAIKQLAKREYTPRVDDEIIDLLLNPRHGQALIYAMFRRDNFKTKSMLFATELILSKVKFIYTPKNSLWLAGLMQYVSELLEAGTLDDWDNGLFYEVLNSELGKNLTYGPLWRSWHNLYTQVLIKYLQRRTAKEPQLVDNDTERAIALYVVRETLVSQRFRRIFYPEAIYQRVPPADPSRSDDLFKPLNIYTVSNNDGYSDSFASNGAPFTTMVGEKILPVGYNIYIPETLRDIKGIVIDVYGGGNVFNKQKFFRAPNALSFLHAKIIDNNIAIITLNLPDLLLNEQSNQPDIPESTFKYILYALKGFVDRLRSNPRFFGTDIRLARLENKPIFLMGNSFGGLLATRFIQVFPKTVDGAISTGGLLSIQEQQKTDFTEISRRVFTTVAHHLDPKQHIDNFVDPLLILHNMDDHNVPISVSLDFFNAAVEKQKPVSFYAIRKGSPIRLSSLDQRAIYQSFLQKGHGVPKDPSLINKMASHINDFVEKRRVRTVINRWHATLSEALFARYNRSVGIEDKFASEGLRLYRSRVETGTGLSSKDILHENPAIREAAFQTFYLPKLNAIYEWHMLQQRNISVMDHARDMVARQVVSDLHLLSATKVGLESMLPFVEELLTISIGPDFDHEQLASQLLPFFRTWIFTEPSYFVEFLWKNILLANNDPALLIFPLKPEQDDHRELIERAKRRLIEAITMYRQRSLDVVYKALKTRAKQLRGSPTKELAIPRKALR